MNLFIKNMVCSRCILMVRQTLEDLKLEPVFVRMGEVELKQPPAGTQLAELDKRLKALGFELLDDGRKKQIEKIKNALIIKVQTGEIEDDFSLSEFVSHALHKEYGQLSRLFSDVEGITLEQFFILQKIEKVKEWLVYNELTINEIAWKLGYSSAAHLSAQFKKVTGMTPTELKKIGVGKRKSLDSVKYKQI